MGVAAKDRNVRPVLYIFFKTEQNTGITPHIFIEAPKETDANVVDMAGNTGFTFGKGGKEACTVEKLPLQYHVDSGPNFLKRIS